MSEIVRENGIIYAVTKLRYYGVWDIRKMPIGTYEEEPIVETPIEEVDEEPKRGKKKKEQSK